MKIFLRRFIIIILAAASVSRAAGQNNFDNTIYTPDNLPVAVSESVKDMAYWLQKSTGKNFTVKTNERCQNKGIQLIWEKEAGLSKTVAEQLKKDGQSFYLYSQPESCTRIVGTGKNSFVNGIYTFLQELGFRWYMPGDAWTVVPSGFPKLSIDKVYTPDFQGRFYAGSGGLGAIPGTDPKNTFRDDYNIWNRRNRFSTDYSIKGHAGQLFYTDNKKVLDANPSWFCHDKVNRFGRIDISNPGVVKLFTEWALGQVKPGDSYPTIGADPADGAGGEEDCLPSGMPGIKTWSDKYFWLANEVAKRLHKTDSKTQVQIYAYAKHAAPPSFSLQQNVYPIIIPYAYQRFTTPGNFLKLWGDKMNGRPMGMYDYWNITLWSLGVPQFNIYSIPERLRLWKQYNITSINLESTNAKGPMGHAFWLTAQMMWNTNLSFDSLYNEFLQKCFGPAAGDIKRMYDRWSLNYQQVMEVDLSLQDLAKASSATRDPVILQRLGELKAYVNYLKLFYDFSNNKNSVPAYERLINYIHSIHDLRLVHSYPLLTRYIVAPKNYKGNAQSRPAKTEGRTDIEKQFQQNLKENNNSYSVSKFSFEISRAKSISSEPPANPQNLTGANSYEFNLPSAREFSLKAGATATTKLQIADTTGAILYEKNIPGAKEGYSDIRVKLPAGIYKLSFGEFGRFSRIVFPKDLAFFSSGVSYYNNGTYPLLYFYVPKDAAEIIYEDQYGPGINKRGFWIDPDGNRVNPQKIKSTVYKVTVPARYRGKIWTLSIGHRSFSMLNIPNNFSLAKFNYQED